MPLSSSTAYDCCVIEILGFGSAFRVLMYLVFDDVNVGNGVATLKVSKAVAGSVYCRIHDPRLERRNFRG